MGAVGAVAGQVYSAVKLKMEAEALRKRMPSEPEHWAFAYSILRKISRTFPFLIQQLRREVRDAVCIYYLVLRALDTVEDDTSISSEIKVPILQSFHRLIYDGDWQFSCGTGDFKVLMENFHHVSSAFLELDESYQVAIADATEKVGAGMPIFICKEIKTVSEYDEYCHYVSGLVGLGLSKLFYISGLEDLAPDSLSNSMGLFLQKVNIIRDYFEDMNDIPKPRKFWPHQIWSKYANRLEDLMCEENSTKSIQCLNEMATNALVHVEECLEYLSALKDPSVFRMCAVTQILSMGMLGLCYNNLGVFRGRVKLRVGIAAKLVDRTRKMSDVYGAVFEFTSLMKVKVDENDPNAALTHKHICAIQKACISSGSLNKSGYGFHDNHNLNNYSTISILVLLLAVLFFTLFMK